MNSLELRSVRIMVRAALGTGVLIFLAVGFFQVLSMPLVKYTSVMGEYACSFYRDLGLQTKCIFTHRAMDVMRRDQPNGWPVCNRITDEDYWREGKKDVPSQYISECYPTFFTHNE